MTKFQIALIIFAILSIIAVPALTYYSSIGGFDKNNVPENHEFAAEWSSDGASHWRSCTHEGCNEVTDKTEHCYGEGIVTTPATEEADGVMTYTCLICGYKKTDAIAKLPHTHVWESEWSNDETHHWHASACGHDEKDRAEHIYDDGYILKPATDTEEGIIEYTCVYCGYSYEDALTPSTHYHSYSDEWTFDENAHWHASTCGHSNIKGKANHVLGAGEVTKEPTEDEEGITSYFCETCDYVKEEPIAKLPHTHVFDENDYCAKCGFRHLKCAYCGNCLSEGCAECNARCLLFEQDKIISFAPNTTLAAPEGPDGLAPGKNGAYIHDQSIKAEYVVLNDGARATLVTLPNGTASHSGISFANNKNVSSVGKAGFNCGIPQFNGVAKNIRLHFTNNGDSEVSFRYSNIDYYYDMGSVDVTLAPGENKVVIMKSTFTRDTVGLNSQIVFPNGADAGASISIWGEFVADNISSVEISVPAKKLNFGVGETFSADGIILSAKGIAPGTESDVYSRVYIYNNYTTDLDGYVFTEEDALAGSKTVTVNFGGLTTTYEVVVNDHIHQIEYVPTVAPVACVSDGVEAHYVCKADGCGVYFADSYGNNVIVAPKTISCHTEPTGTILPGSVISCTLCGKEYGVKSMDNWVHFGITTQTSKIGSNIKNGKLEHGYVDGVPGTKIYIGAGTKGATTESEFYLQMSNNDPGWQTVIPNLGNNAPEGQLRKVILYYRNYSDQDVVMNLQNDASGGNGKVTIPANGTALCEFTIKNKNGSNWFHYYVDCDIKTDVVLGVYGYFYIYDEEVDSISINKTPEKLTYKVGESFSTKDLILDVPITMGIGKTCYVQTGFTTNYDGYVFTADDVGKHTVIVEFAGKTCTYEIEVVEE